MRTTKFAQLAWLLQQTKITETFNSIQKFTKYLRVYFKMKFIEKQPLFVIVDVSASTEAFFGTVCLITVCCSVLGQTGCRMFFNEFHYEIVYRSTYLILV